MGQIMTQLFFRVAIPAFILGAVLFILAAILAGLKKSKGALVVGISGLICVALSLSVVVVAAFVGSSKEVPDGGSSYAEPDLSVTFTDIYTEWEANELRGREAYEGNRYRITGEINGTRMAGEEQMVCIPVIWSCKKQD